MNVQAENAAEKKETAPKKKFWTRAKKFLAFLLALGVLCVGVYRYLDKPAKLVQTTDPDGADPAKGEIVDYRFLYNELQDKALNPPEENGWRLILQALGPRALDRDQLAYTVPWEEFPTNDASKEWFSDQWTRLCEKFGINPFERPTMHDRMDLWNYLSKNGATGQEPDPDPSVYAEHIYGTYHERLETGLSRFDGNDAGFQEKLMTSPWTARQYPIAAQWLEENADFYDLLAKAARSPKLGCWNFAPDVDDAGIIRTQTPGVESTKKFVKLLAVRASFRVGSNDIAGAIDDVETISLFARSLLDKEYSFLSERLDGIACLEIGANVPIFANPSLATPEEKARGAELWDAFFQNDQTARFYQLAVSGERVRRLGIYSDVLATRRAGNLTRFINQNLPNANLGPLSSFNRFLLWLKLSARPVNDVKSFKYFMDYYVEATGKSQDELDAWLAQNAKNRSLALLPSEKKLAAYFCLQLLPPLNAAREAYANVEKAAKEAVQGRGTFAAPSEDQESPEEENAGAAEEL